MFHTFTDYTWFCVKILLTDVTSSRVPICNRLVLSGKDSWRSRKWCFLSNQRKYIFQLWRRKPFVVGNGFFAFLFCFVYEASLLQKCKLSGKRRTLLSSSRRNANKFSNWAAFREGWLFLFKKGISRWFFSHVIVFGWQLAFILALPRPRKPLLDLSHQREDFSQQKWSLFPSFQETKTLINLISVQKKIKKKTRAFNS